MIRGNKKNKASAGHGRSIDGIISSGRRSGLTTGRLGASSAMPFHPNRNQPVDSLGAARHRAEGFHPMRSGSGSLGLPTGRGAKATSAETNLLLDEPIILDELTDSKNDTPARHRRFKLGFKRSALALLAVIIAGSLFMGIKFYITERHLFRGGGGAPALAKNIDINQLKGEGDGRINILILGIGGPGHEGPNLTDTIMVASIDPINHATVLLSIPRDLCVKMPCGPNQKINATYALAEESSTAKDDIGQKQDGLKKLDATLSPILGIPIHYHAVVDFAAFKQSVDAVGGVDVDVPEQLYDPTIAWENNYNSVIAQKGQQHMNGAKALLYAKSRETSSDFARGERQRLILVALKQKIFTLGTFSNPVKVSNLLSSLGNNVYTDFSLNDINRLYQIISTIPSGSIASLDLVTPPHDLLTTGSVDGATSIVEPKAGLFSYSALNSYIRNALRDGLLIKENAPVAIYNATSLSGLATKEADLLKSYGYNVTTVGSLPKATDPAKSVLVDLSAGSDKYTRHYLEQRLGLSAQNSLPAGTGVTPPSGTKFVIIVGKDANNSTQ